MENNRDFIKGGLPLGSKDFINQDNVREKKSRLLAALDNINKVHDEKMSSAITNDSYEANNVAIDNTLNMVNQEMTQPVQASQYDPDEYVDSTNINNLFDNINNTNTPVEFDFSSIEQQNSNNTFDDDSSDAFTPVNMDSESTPFQIDESVFEQPQDYQDFNVDSTAQDFEHNEFNAPETPEVGENQGKPDFVVDDSQVGKRAKGKGAKSMSGDVKNGRFVAWMAYIVFFIPLLFAGKNKFVRHHANEGLCINILDVIGIVLFVVSQKVTHELESVKMVLLGCGLLGIAIICLTVFSRIIMIIGALAGKETEAPLFGKVKFIK